VSWVPGDPIEPARVAFAIGRRVGSAVDRNRVRRRLRALVRETPAPVPAGAYLIGVAPGATELTYAQLGASLEDALHKAHARRAVSTGARA
jgi:ribonuclease P protein component